MPPERKSPVDILLVEDNLGDADLIREAFLEGQVPANVLVTRDGVEALDFLRRRGAYVEAPRPDLVLLDLNLPRKDGREVLAEIKGDESLKELPVIVLTTSVSAEDVRISYRLGANSFIIKPMVVDDLFEITRKIEEYWFTMVRLPGP